MDRGAVSDALSPERHGGARRLLTLAHVPAGIAGDDVGGDIT